MSLRERLVYETMLSSKNFTIKEKRMYRGGEVIMFYTPAAPVLERCYTEAYGKCIRNNGLSLALLMYKNGALENTERLNGLCKPGFAEMNSRQVAKWILRDTRQTRGVSICDR